jgi:PBP1b-binding outer membrane lipoprotein LpoB
MQKKSLILGSVVVGTLLFTGCGTEVNLSKFPKSVTEGVKIPDICKSEYDKLKNIPKVAVIRFSNNSSFGVADTTNTNVDSHTNTVNTGVKASGTYIGAVGGGVGVGHVSTHKNTTDTKTKTNVNTTSRTVDPKLDKSITSAIETVLASMGGADVFSREDMDKVLKEQNFQQSGLVDENTIVSVGKLAGVKYIITGSLDSVSQDFKDYSAVSDTVNNSGDGKDSLGGMLLKSAISFGASHKSGMHITARVSVKVIDVETGKIVLTKKIEETQNIGMMKNPTYDQVIGGIKGAISGGLNQMVPEMSDFFAVKGYIIQVKSDKKGEDYIAQINLGKANKVTPEQKFYAYKFEELKDPISGKTSCSKNRLNVELTVSKNQINRNNTWTVADGDDASELRAGQIIKRAALD